MSENQDVANSGKKKVKVEKLSLNLQEELHEGDMESPMYLDPFRKMTRSGVRGRQSIATNYYSKMRTIDLYKSY